MGFRIPGEGVSDRFRQRMQRSQQAQEEQENARHEKIQRQIARMEFQEETRKWVERITYDMYLLAGTILDMAIDERGMLAPKDPDDEWSEEFCRAVENVNEARMFLEETEIRNIKTEFTK